MIKVNVMEMENKKKKKERVGNDKKAMEREMQPKEREIEEANH